MGKVVSVADFLPEAMARLPDKGESVFVRDDRQDDLERVKTNHLEEMKREILRDYQLTPQQADVELESFDGDGKPVFVLRLKGPV